MSYDSSLNICKSLGIQIPKKIPDSGNILTYCIWHNNTKTPALSISLVKGNWYCHGCSNYGYFSSADEEKWGSFDVRIETLLESIKRGSTTTLPENKPIEPSVLKQFAFYHKYLKERGISFETAKANQIGFDRIFGGAITIPLWLNDNLYGIIRRTVRQNFEPKYSNSGGLHKSKLLFIPKGLKQLSCNNNFTLVVEGPLDALKAYEFGYKAVAILGAMPTLKQVELVMQAAKGTQIILAFDNDEAGQKATERFLELTNEILWLVKMPEGVKDIGLTDKEQLDTMVKERQIRYAL